MINNKLVISQNYNIKKMQADKIEILSTSSSSEDTSEISLSSDSSDMVFRENVLIANPTT